MALNTSYLITSKNLEAFFNALTTAKAPDRFTQKFLETLEFKSSNDRLYIGLLKSLGFIDESGVPQERYYSFLDQTRSKHILAEAIREAYSDLFAINTKAQELTVQDVKNKFRTLTQGKKNDNVLQYMANTFHALSEYADWSNIPHEGKPEFEKPIPAKKKDKDTNSTGQEQIDDSDSNRSKFSEFHYNIQIHLPETRDQGVYDAIFKSLKDHMF